MTNENQEEEPKKEEQTKSPSKLDEARDVLAKIEAANLEAAKLIAKNEEIMAEELVSGKADAGKEEIMAEELISGRADAGKEPPKEDPEKEIKEAANKILEGSGFSV